MLILSLSMYAYCIAHQQNLSDAETFVEIIVLIFNLQFLVSFCSAICFVTMDKWLDCLAV